jgi:hypothetical protein
MPVAARPGMTYFVPGVRIKKLGPQLRQGAEPGDDLPYVAPDIARVEVTRVNTGAAQFSITLNNWYDSLPADRRDGLREDELYRNGKPLWPRYKYNNLVRLAFGDRLRVDMRYWPDPAPGLDAAVTSAQNWVPMVAGPITDMHFSFSVSEGAQVTISGEDDLSQLKDKTDDRTEFKKVSEKQIVLKMLAKANYPLQEIAPSQVAWPAFAEDDSRGLSESLQDGQSYLEFLQKLADHLDFEIFLEFADLTDPGSGVTFHFEPARSRLPPDNTLRNIYVLRREQNLLDFAPTIKVIDQYTELVVKGRHRDRKKPERVVQAADPSVLADELHIDPGQGDKPLLSGPQIRLKYFPGRKNKAQLPNQTNLDDERGRQLAESMLRKKAREFMTIDGTTIGLPRLRPGNHVEIRGMRPPFDGFYYVTKTVHSYGTDGLRTKFTARRPGMPEPPYGEA